MTRPRLRRPDQPAGLQLLLGLFEAAASLKLAVCVITVSAVVLGWATFVEKWYGTEAVSFGIYQSWWFALLMGLLGLNVLCAALIRYPWKRYQTGFVITHAGILVLLGGCLVQSVWGIHGNLVIIEGDCSRRVFEDKKLFRLAVSPIAADKSASKPEEIEVPFRSGPFNWDKYEDLSFFPWRLAARDHGLIFDQDGIRLEVLDYYADSKRVRLPRVQLSVTPLEGSPHAAMMGASGSETVELAVVNERGLRLPRRESGFGALESTQFGPSIAFWMTRSEAEVRAFLATTPQGELGPAGQVVLWHDGQVYRFPVSKLQGQPEQPLGDSGLTASLAHVDPRFRGVQLEIRRGSQPPVRMILYADLPHFNDHAGALGVYGSLWVEPPEPPGGPASRAALASKMRLDLLQGDDGKLYYREWIAPEVKSQGVLATGEVSADAAGEDGEETALEAGDDEPVTLAAFRDSTLPLRFDLRRYTPAAAPEVMIEPEPFRADPRGEMKQARAKIRLTVDGNSGEFWLPLGGPSSRDEVAVVTGEDRRVEIILAQRIFDLGFELYLHDFKRKVDPGAPVDSHYSSLVDVRERGAEGDVLHPKTLITMNQPLETTDPESGRTYRFYQASFTYLGKPGDPTFDDLVYGDEDRPVESIPRDDLYRSVLSLNYDPGRGLKYAGSLLIVVGIATMFYMKAYFFRRRDPDRLTGQHAPARQPAAV